MKNKEVIKNVPSAQKTKEWDAKETTEGSQAKADKALLDAKKYADEYKVEKVLGKQLSTEDFTTAEKTKLALIEPYTHPPKHTIDEIYTSSSARFVSDNQIKSWTSKETVEGAQAKVDKAVFEINTNIDKIKNSLNIEKFDYAEINQQKQLVFKANGVIKNTLQLPLGEGSSNYVLPAATKTLLGGVKIGPGLSVRSDGMISVSLNDIGSIDWINISGKPLSFPPTSHTHNRSEITDMFNVVDDFSSSSPVDALSARRGQELKGLLDTVTHEHENLTTLNLITPTKIEEWTNKETKAGSQEKSNKALSDAKAYVDSRLELVPIMLYYKTTVSNWAPFDDASTLFKSTIVHNLDCTEIIVESFNEQNISEFTSYRVVDANSIELFSENQATLRVTILGLFKKQINI